MQIITSPLTIANSLRHLACGLATDSPSWVNWYALSVRSEPALAGTTLHRLAETIQQLLSGHDGAVLRGQNGTCLAIFNDATRFDKLGFTTQLEDAMAFAGASLHAACLDVATDTAATMQLLSQYDTDEDETDGQPPIDFNTSVAHFEDLQRLWTRSREGSDKRKKTHVMIVDDDAMTRSIVHHTLKADYEVIAAENCADAIRKHILHAPDIVFMDIGLPDHSGLKLLKFIRRNDPSCRVIVFSGDGYLGNRLKAFASGAAGFIAKPFNRQQFNRYIRYWAEPIDPRRKKLFI